MYAVPYMSLHLRKSVDTSSEIVFIDIRNRSNRDISIAAYLHTRMTNGSKTGWKRVHYYNKPGWISNPEIFSKCAYACYLTSGEHIEDIDAETAIIFHAPDIITAPMKKKQGQIWIFHSMESPTSHHDILSSWNHLFNWTLGYRRDADIFSPYSIFHSINSSSKSVHITNQNVSPDVISKHVWEAKKNDAVWMVSKCNTPSRRDQYALQLGKLIGVDVFGSCGKFLCPRRQQDLCQRFMRKWYKFYLSFENSLCADYVTEKVFALYTRNIDLIPISRSGANLSMYLPPGSYVTTQDFDTIPSLGKHMKDISLDRERFQKYFSWKRFYNSFESINSDEAFCGLCRRLHDNNNKYNRVYDNISEWLTWNNSRRICPTYVTDT